MSARDGEQGFGENPQKPFDPSDFDLTDPDLLEALDCVAGEPGASGGHPPESIEGRHAQLAYLDARIEEGLRDIEAGRVLRGAEADAFLQALSEGRMPALPDWLKAEIES